jgi:hypothetical protein
MPLLPYKNYELVSDQTPSEVEAAMRSVVAPRRTFRFAAAPRAFEGEVGDRTFDVQRAIGYRNSFLPQIRGDIMAAAGGSRIVVRMRLRLAILVVMIIWMGGVGAASLQILISELRQGGSPSTALGPAAMFLFGWFLSAAGFTYEARIAEPLLERVMTARPGNDTVQPRAADGTAPRG